MGGDKGGTIVFGLADETAANPTLLADGLRGDATPSDRRRRPRRRRAGRRYDGLPGRRADRPRCSPSRPTRASRRGLHRRRQDVRGDRRVAEDHRRQGLPGRPERRVRRATSSPIFDQAREGREVRGRATSATPASAPRRSTRRAASRPRTPRPATALGKLDVSPADASTNAGSWSRRSRPSQGLQEGRLRGRQEGPRGYKSTAARPSPPARTSRRHSPASRRRLRAPAKVTGATARSRSSRRSRATRRSPSRRAGGGGAVTRPR